MPGLTNALHLWLADIVRKGGLAGYPHMVAVPELVTVGLLARAPLKLRVRWEPLDNDAADVVTICALRVHPRVGGVNVTLRFDFLNFLIFCKSFIMLGDEVVPH